MAHGLQRAVAAAALAVAPGDGLRPVGRAQGLGQHGFDARDELLGALDQRSNFSFILASSAYHQAQAAINFSKSRTVVGVDRHVVVAEVAGPHRVLARHHGPAARAR
jgi:hypothetical protein